MTLRMSPTWMPAIRMTTNDGDDVSGQDLTDDWAGECVTVEEGGGVVFKHARRHHVPSCPRAARASTTRLVHPSIPLSHCCALAAVEHHIACEILAISKINRAACTLAFAHTFASEQGVDTVLGCRFGI